MNSSNLLNDVKIAIAKIDVDMLIISFENLRHNLESYESNIAELVSRPDKYGLRVVDYVNKTKNKNISRIFCYYVPNASSAVHCECEVDNELRNYDFVGYVNKMINTCARVVISSFKNESEVVNYFYVEMISFLSFMVSLLIAFLFTLIFFYCHQNASSNSYTSQYKLQIDITYFICICSQGLLMKFVWDILHSDPGYIDNYNHNKNDSPSPDRNPYDLAIMRMVSELTQLRRTQLVQNKHEQCEAIRSDMLPPSSDYICHQCRLYRPYRAGHSYFSKYLFSRD